MPALGTDGRTLLAWAQGGRYRAFMPVLLGSQINVTILDCARRKKDKGQDMTSKERHEARYQRRKAAREAKRYEQVKDSLDFDKVFSFRHMYKSARQCYKQVDWKASVQAHRSRCGIKVKRRCRELQEGKLVLHKSPEFYIRERGRERRINSIGINDRVPQKCNSKYALKPVLHRSLLYDNYASQENKGTSLARKRIKKQLTHHIRKYGVTGGVIVIDLHHFFDSIKHSEVRKLLEKNFPDERIIGFNMRVIRNGRNGTGLVLGSENSQDFAVAVPDAFDHYVKETLHVDGYARYVDDILITHHDYDYLAEVFPKIRRFAAGIGFSLNEKKSRLIRFGRQFTMLKRKYDFTESGHIIVRPARESVIRERRRLKKLYRKAKNGEIPFHTVWESWQSWQSSISDTKCWKIRRSIRDMFNHMFVTPWLTGEERGTAVCM